MFLRLTIKSPTTNWPAGDKRPVLEYCLGRPELLAPHWYKEVLFSPPRLLAFGLSRKYSGLISTALTVPETLLVRRWVLCEVATPLATKLWRLPLVKGRFVDYLEAHLPLSE